MGMTHQANIVATLTTTATIAISVAMTTINNTFVFVDPTILVKECLPENMYLEVWVPSLLACAMICSTYPSCRGVSFVTGSRGCIACNDSYVAVAESNANLTGAMVYQKVASRGCIACNDSYVAVAESNTNLTGAMMYQKRLSEGCPGPEEWITYKDSDYLIVEEADHFEGAEKTCSNKDQPSTHVVLDTLDEQEHLIEILKKCGGDYWTDALAYGILGRWLWYSNFKKIPVIDNDLWAAEAVSAAQDAIRVEVVVFNESYWAGCMSSDYNYKMSVCKFDQDGYSVEARPMMAFVCEHNKTVQN